MPYTMFDDNIRSVLKQRGSPVRAGGAFMNSKGEYIDPRTGLPSQEARDFAVRQMYVPGRQNELAYKAKQPGQGQVAKKSGGRSRAKPSGGGGGGVNLPKSAPTPTANPNAQPGDPESWIDPSTAIGASLLALLAGGAGYGAYKYFNRPRTALRPTAAVDVEPSIAPDNAKLGGLIDATGQPLLLPPPGTSGRTATGTPEETILKRVYPGGEPMDITPSPRGAIAAPTPGPVNPDGTPALTEGDVERTINMPRDSDGNVINLPDQSVPEVPDTPSGSSKQPRFRPDVKPKAKTKTKVKT